MQQIPFDRPVKGRPLTQQPSTPLSSRLSGILVHQVAVWPPVEQLFWNLDWQHFEVRSDPNFDALKLLVSGRTTPLICLQGRSIYECEIWDGALTSGSQECLIPSTRLH